jgi:predicted Rossmann-fold nucleotide-binding protein
MRKLWFAHLARALVVFPGGFGTLDELTEVLTLAQTAKLERRIPILLFGSEYWHEVINFKAMLKYGMIDEQDMALFEFVDAATPAFERLRSLLGPPDAGETPDFAHSRTRVGKI